MQHEVQARTETTTAIVVARGALRRSAWASLLAAQPRLDVMTPSGWPPDLASMRRPMQAAVVVVDASPTHAVEPGELVSTVGGLGVLWLLDDVELAPVVALLRAGVLGCLPIESTADDLARAVVAVARGEIVLPPSIARQALAALASSMPLGTGGPDELTGREQEVVDLLVQGMTNKDIAQTLFLSVRTVEAHLRSIYGKLGVRSRTEAVLWAIARQREAPR